VAVGWTTFETTLLIIPAKFYILFGAFTLLVDGKILIF